MTTTRDGHQLSIGEKYTVVSFVEDTQDIESTTECIYWGNWVQDNTHCLGAMGNSCSGWFPQTLNIHRFIPIDVDENFELIKCEVGELVVKHPSVIESVVVRRLK
ncbi:hypothetical protein LCGC14_0141250 [marine sediment metagenome]|uniref:Uncharacterized protein n=1 Tax=marine sediment metagenome TaxID=412755 RepID=A0A0F9V4H4_9ZZZZ